MTEDTFDWFTAEHCSYCARHKDCHLAEALTAARLWVKPFPQDLTKHLTEDHTVLGTHFSCKLFTPNGESKHRVLFYKSIPANSLELDTGKTFLGSLSISEKHYSWRIRAAISYGSHFKQFSKDVSVYATDKDAARRQIEDMVESLVPSGGNAVIYELKLLSSEG
jgi:hypothetical protein